MRYDSNNTTPGFIDHKFSLENNSANLSSLNSFAATVCNTVNYGIKYVMQGREHYRLNNTRHTIHENQYLLINPGNSFECEVKEKNRVQGMCIGLDAQLLNAVYADIERPENALLDTPVEAVHTNFEFIETVYHAEGTIRNTLQKIVKSFSDNTVLNDPMEMYYHVAHDLLRSPAVTSSRINNLNAVHEKTKKELFSRLNFAKNIIDGNIDGKLAIADIAREASLSQFHFHRSFKAAFGISPYRYIIRKRLERSFQMLKTSQCSVTDVALSSGYGDIFTFSKAFKKFFKRTPSEVMEMGG